MLKRFSSNTILHPLALYQRGTVSVDAWGRQTSTGALSLPARGWLDTQAHGASLCGTWHPWPRLSVNLFLQDSRTTGIAGHLPSPERVADVAPPSPGSRPQGRPMAVVMSPVSRGWSLSPMPEELPLCPRSPLTSSPCSRSRFLHVASELLMWFGLFLAVAQFCVIVFR